MSSLQLVLSFVLLLIVELMYFLLARKYSIVDHPNERTLHERPTIRGGGVVFYFAVILYGIFTGWFELWFFVGLTLVSVIGLLDDVISLKSSIRFLVQVMAFGFLFYELNLWSLELWIVLLMWIVAVGTLNAYNFMDGVNGMTGGYSLVTMGSLIAVDQTRIDFVDDSFLWFIVMALVVFNFFNFRKKAICFAGDVGSYSMAFIIIYLLLLLSIKSNNYIFILFLALYGIDTVLTILHRLLRKENIFKPHRFHLFQVLVSHYKLSHLQVSSIYLVVQLIVNVILMACLNQSHGAQYMIGMGILFMLASLYSVLKGSRRFSRI